MLALVVAGQLVVCLTAQDPRPTFEGEVFRILSRVQEESEAGGDRACSRGAEELSSLGADVAEPLFQILVGYRMPSAPDDDGSGPELTESQERTLLLALAAEGRDHLLAICEAAREKHPDASTLAASLRVLGAVGTIHDLERALVLASMGLDDGGIPTVLEDTLEGALLGIFARHPRAIQELRGSLFHVPVLLQPAIVRAVEGAGSPEGLMLFTDMLDWSDGLEVTLLTGIASLAPLASLEEASEAADRVVGLVAEDDVRIALAAAHALGRLRVPESVPVLVEALDREDSTLQRMALTALRDIAGLSLPPSAPAWRTWYAMEIAWREERSPGLVEALAASDAAAAIEAIRALSEHSLFRDRLALSLERALESASPEVRGFACDAAKRLGSRFAVPWLVAALDDPEAAVATRAFAALKAITGQDLPEDSAAWAAVAKER